MSINNLNEITLEAIDGQGCSRENALKLATECGLDELKDSATKIREHFFNNKVNLCVIINARSGACVEDCRYCSQSAHNDSPVEIYDLLPEEKIVGEAKKLSASGAKNYGVVTSGATVEGEDLNKLCETLGKIPAESGLQPCASLGRFNEEKLTKLKNAGLARYHHNLETSKNFYPEICTTHDWSERVDTVRAAFAAGLDVCSGGLFGLGESWEDRIDLAITIRELGVKNVPLNFLHSHPGTPMANHPPLTTDEALRIIAVYRHLLPDATLRVCGGRPKILNERQGEIFAYGANAMMTGNYLTTSGITPEKDLEMIKSLGLKIDKE